MKSKLSQNLARRLSLNIMLMAVPVFALSLGILYMQSRRLIHHEAVKRANSALRVAVHHMDNYMNTIEFSTNANAWLLEKHFLCPDSIESITQRMLRLNPNILSCSVSAVPDAVPQYGHLFSIYTVHHDSIISVRETDFDYTEKSWYKAARSKSEASWVEPFSEYADGTVNHNDAVATYCRQLRSPEGDVLGIVSAEFSFSTMTKKVIASEHPYPDAYFVLLGGDGRYFSHPDTARLYRKTVFQDADPVDNADIIALGYEMTEGRQGEMHVKLNGKICHVNYCPVEGTDWSLAMVCPDSEILSGYQRLGFVIALILFFGFIMMWWLCQRSVRQTIRPLKKLLGYTERITSGDYSETIPHSEQRDDVGRLQNGFADMQDALRENMGRISKAADTIKKQNEERSKEMKLAEEVVKQKTAFIQNVSHQIRTPLNIISGFSNMLYEDIVHRHENGEVGKDIKEDNKLEIADTMKYNAFHLKRMIIMLYDSSSLKGDDKLLNAAQNGEEVSCNEIARECINSTLAQFPDVVIKLTSDLSDQVYIVTNHLYMVRIIRELLYNAAKYSDGLHIKLHISETSTHVLFTVEDVGPGLSGNVDELMNKPFNKLDDLSEGLGLGLPLTKRHALSMGGDLIYDANYSAGCRFIVEMPK